MTKTLPGITLALVLLGSAPAALAQTTGVGIGTTAPDASAALDIVSSGKGVLLPRVASAASVASPAPGLLLYQTGSPAGFYYNAGTAAAPSWQQLATSANGDNLGNHTATQSLNLAGNFLIGTGDTVSTTAQGLGVRADGGLNLGQNNGHNVVLGFQAGGNMMPNLMTNTGINNTLVGYSAGRALTTGYGNVFSGLNAGRSTTSGTSNVFSGANAGLKNTTGSDNVLIGVGAGIGNTTGASNVFLGPSAGSRNTTGNNNLYLGNSAGYSNVGGSGNIALGYNTASAQPSATNTVVVGYNAQLGASGLSNATAIGYNAVVSQSNSLVLGGTGGDAVSVGIGTAAPATTLHVAGTAGTPNVRLGSLGGTGTRLVTADANGNLSSQAIPASTPSWNLSGNSLTGVEFLGSTNDEDLVIKRNNTEAFRVLSNGRVTLGNNTYTSSSVLLGFNAGVTFNTVANDNTHGQSTFVGARAGQNNNADGNTLIGYAAGQNATGYTNTMLGMNAGSRMTSGTNNVFIGASAAYGSTTPTGSNNVAIGANAGATLTTNTNNILLGGNSAASAGLYDAYAIGSGASVAQSNSLVIGTNRGTNDAVSVGIGTSAPTSTLQVNGTFAVGVVNNFGGGTSSNANSIDQGTLNTTLIGGYYGLAPGSGQYYRLPDPGTCAGRVYYLRNNSSSDNAVLTVNSGQLIDSAAGAGSSQYTLNTSGSSKTVIAISDGTNWTIMRTGS